MYLYIYIYTYTHIHFIYNLQPSLQLGLPKWNVKINQTERVNRLKDCFIVGC